MPFGLDLKSLIIGALFVWFVLPMVTGMIGRRGASNKAA